MFLINNEICIIRASCVIRVNHNNYETLKQININQKVTLAPTNTFTKFINLRFKVLNAN